MQFYKFFPGDFARDTAHLTLIQRGAYRAMLDFFYSTEKPLPTGDALYRIVCAVSKAERLAVATVCAEFWQPHPDGGIVNKRAMREMERAEHIATRSRKNGTAGGRPKEPRKNPVGFSEVTKNEPETGQNKTQTITSKNLLPDARHQTMSSPTATTTRAHAHEGPPPAPPSANASSSSFGEAIFQRGNEIAAMLAAMGARLNPAEPVLLQWAADRVPDADILRAMTTAKIQRGASSQPIGVKLLDAIIRGQKPGTDAPPPAGRFDSLAYVNRNQEGSRNERVINP